MQTANLINILMQLMFITSRSYIDNARKERIQNLASDENERRNILY